jgi:hypothetical protein
MTSTNCKIKAVTFSVTQDQITYRSRIRSRRSRQPVFPQVRGGHGFGHDRSRARFSRAVTFSPLPVKAGEKVTRETRQDRDLSEPLNGPPP